MTQVMEYDGRATITIQTKLVDVQSGNVTFSRGRCFCASCGADSTDVSGMHVGDVAVFWCKCGRVWRTSVESGEFIAEDLHAG